ncbi:MAG TPA: cation:proton antiporter [Nitrospira sp.]
MLNGFIFILIGLQLGALREAVPAGRIGPLLWTAVLINLTVILVRLGWVPLAAVVPRVLSPSLRARDPMPPWQQVFLVAWTGMRGIVTLAAALALPVTTAAGVSFPFRAEIILLSFSVILTTLVLQGLSLPPMIRILHLDDDDSLEHEEMLARERAVTAAVDRLNALAGEKWASADHVDKLRDHYDRRRKRSASSLADPELSNQTADLFRRLRHETIMAERAALIDLRNDDTISDDVLHRLEYELDVEALRLGLAGRRTL